MAGTTTKGLRYPTAGDNPAVHTDIQNLATDIDTALNGYIPTSGIVSLVFEGTTNDSAELTLTTVDPSVDRTVTIPDASGTVILDSATQTLSNKTLVSPIFTGQVTGLEIGFGQSIVFEGTTANAFELTLSAGDPTADVTVTLPDETDKLANENFVRTSVLMLGGM